MKLSHFAAALAIVLGFHAAHAQVFVITNFGDSATNDGTWFYDPVTSTISGLDSNGSFIFGTSQTVDLSTDRVVQLTANATTVPAGAATFTITLTDSDDNTAVATFNWSSFSGSSTTVAKPLDYGTFDFSHVSSWSLDSGNSGSMVNISFSQLSAAAAVPEQSTCLLLNCGASVLWLGSRRRFALQPAKAVNRTLPLPETRDEDRSL